MHPLPMRPRSRPEEPAYSAQPTSWEFSGYDRADIVYTHFDPRLGVAYSINRKTVISAGYSINHLNGGSVRFRQQQTELQYGTLLDGISNVNSNGSNIPGNGQWDLHPLPLPGETPFSPTEFNGNGALHAFAKNPGSYQYGQNWNIGIQRELPYPGAPRYERYIRS